MTVKSYRSRGASQVFSSPSASPRFIVVRSHWFLYGVSVTRMRPVFLLSGESHPRNEVSPPTRLAESWDSFRMMPPPLSALSLGEKIRFTKSEYQLTHKGYESSLQVDWSILVHPFPFTPMSRGVTRMVQYDSLCKNGGGFPPFFIRIEIALQMC